MKLLVLAVCFMGLCFANPVSNYWCHKNMWIHHTELMKPIKYIMCLCTGWWAYPREALIQWVRRGLFLSSATPTLRIQKMFEMSVAAFRDCMVVFSEYFRAMNESHAKPPWHLEMITFAIKWLVVYVSGGLLIAHFKYTTWLIILCSLCF